MTWKTLSKSQDAVALQQIKGVALYLIDRGDIRQAIDRCSNIWASLPGAGYGQFRHKADSLIAKFKEAGGTVREIDVWAGVTAIISLWLSASSPSSWAVNHYRDNATLQAQRDKNARELKLANAAITDMQMRQRDVAALDAKYTERLADAKAENDALRDDVAAGRRRVCTSSSLSVSAWSHAASGVDNAASPDWQTPLNGIISPSEGWSLCKNNWKEPKYINEQCR